MSRPDSYHRRHFGVSRLYAGIDRNGKTMSVFAHTKKEAAADMRKKGFRPVKVIQS